MIGTKVNSAGRQGSREWKARTSELWHVLERISDRRSHRSNWYILTTWANASLNYNLESRTYRGIYFCVSSSICRASIQYEN